MPTMVPHALPAEDVEAVLRMWAPSANKLDFRSTSCPASRCTEPVELPPIRSLSEVEVIAATTSQPTQLATVTEAARETGVKAVTADADATKANPLHFGAAVAAEAAASPPASQQQQQQPATSMLEQPSLLAWQQWASNAPMQQQQQQPLLDSFALLTTGTVEPTASQEPVDPFGNAAAEGPTAGSAAVTSSSSALFDSFSHAAAAAAVTTPVLLDPFSSAAAAAANPPLPPWPPQSASTAPPPAGSTAASSMLADPFSAAAAAAAVVSPPATGFTDPFSNAAAAAGAAARGAAAAEPFSSAAAVSPPAPALIDPVSTAASAGAAAAADPFSSAAARPPAPAFTDPFSSAAAAAAAAPAFTDPFSQMAASHLPQPPPAQPITAASESDFAAEFAEYNVGFGAGLHTHAGNNAAVGSDLLEALPYNINTCVLGEHGDCTIEEGMPLASGSFGTVYPGYYFDDPVAVKLLRVGLGEDEAAVRSRILKEVQLQARAINHSGVVKFVAVCFSPPAIVMEMCECSLTARIHNHWAAQQHQRQPLGQIHSMQAQQSPHHNQQQQQQQQHCKPYHHQQQLQLGLSWGLVVTLLRQAAAALAFLHRPGYTILHNDVRAANMVLTRTYDMGKPSWKLKICDFGLAVAAGPDGVAQVPELTHVSWRAPELQKPPAFNPVTGMYTVTPAADVYALGCVLHEMMVPGVPQQQFPPADQRLPGLSDPPPAGLEELLQSCLAEASISRRTAQTIMMDLRSMQHSAGMAYA